MEGKTEFNIFNVINTVGKRLKKMELLDGLIEVLDEELQTIADYLQTTKQQALIFSVIFRLNLNDDDCVNFRNIARYLSTDIVDLMIFQSSIDELIERRILQKNRTRSQSSIKLMKFEYSISPILVDAIICNQPLPSLTKTQDMSIYDFVHNISKMLELAHRETITSTYELYENIEEIECKNEHLELVNVLHALNFDLFERTIFYELCSNLFHHANNTPLDKTLSCIFTDVREKLEYTHEILAKNARMFTLDLVEIESDEFTSNSSLKLTDKGIEFVVNEDSHLFMKKVKSQNLIYPDKIVSKELFFDDELNKQISFLEKSLELENFDNLQNRLSDKGMNKGVVSIFFGSPGTGKTESVFQIAKNTNRAIYHVDISTSKSKFFGESEKMIKDIFLNYNRLCKSESTTPILLFNEADALFCKRKENGESNTQSTENAIQAILLEELENFQGILIATTNLNNNLDSAFERRFLFKIKFDSPSLEVKKKIWESKLDLKDEEAHILANKFQFSGAEIENIHRKLVIESVLYNTTPNIDKIVDFCNNEKFSNKNSNRIGY